MRFCSVFLISGALFLLPFHPDAAEYGGGWGEGSIRTHSLQYIEETKARFDLRAARMAEVIDFEVPLKYRETSDNQKEVYEKFLKDRTSDSDRTLLLRTMLNDLETVRVQLAEAEKKAFVAWEKLPRDVKVEKAAMVEGEIYGTKVTASNLGVVLDNSPSMRSYLPAVREEIAQSFPSAHYRESAGSGLRVKKYYSQGERLEVDDRWFYGEMPIDTANPFDPKWHQPKIAVEIEPHYRQIQLERNPFAALMALVELQEIDTLYWFCDFEDDIEQDVLKSLEEAILSREVRFYVHSSGRRPDKGIVEIVEKSGGEVIRKRIR